MLVVDASVVVKFVCEEEGSEAAARLLATDEELVAPDLMMVEVANALWHKVKASLMMEIHAGRALEDIPQYFTLLYPALDLLDDAWRLAFSLRHHVQDCICLALARRLDVPYLTADDRFIAKARPRFGSLVRPLL